VRSDTAAASRPAWSNPRRRRRAPGVGTGTSAAPSASTAGGAVATICAAISPASPSAPWNLRAWTTARAGPSNPSGAHARATSEPAIGQRVPHGAGSAQRGQRGPGSQGSAARQAGHSGWPGRGGRRHATHAGGATSATAAASQSGGSMGGTPGMLTGLVSRLYTGLPQSRAVPADTSWTFEPGAIAMIAVLGGLYVGRWRRVRARHGTITVSGVRLASFLAGLLALGIALISPVDRLAEQAFTMHMVQHVLLLDLAPIALICGLTKVLLRPVTKRMQRVERRAGLLAHPVFAIFAYVGLMWLWHVPALYDAALRHSFVHVIEHVTFLGVGLLYWWHLLSPIRSRHRLSAMGAVVYMVSTKLFVGLLGIALTFAPEALYEFYKQQPPIWGLNPSEDESLAGGLMALEQSIVMGIALVWLFIAALTEADAKDWRLERYPSSS
jgi:putative membrane protein